MGKPWQYPTAELMSEAGYVFIERRKCTYEPCTAEIEIWRTPNGRLMPFDRRAVRTEKPDAAGNKLATLLDPHFASCAGLDRRNAVTKESRERVKKGLAPIHQEPEPGERVQN
jgi:hypothetical protein